MKIDQEIRKSLEQQAAEDEELLLPERGLFGMLGNAFTGKLGRWVWVINAVAVVASILMFWAGWEFFTADVIDERLYWGICLVIAVQAQSMLKMWIFQEMNRSSIAREIKRLEVIVNQQQKQ